MGVVVVDQDIQRRDTVQDMVVAHSNRFTTRTTLQLNAGCRCTTSTKTDQHCKRPLCWPRPSLPRT
jgi:hypothetical protein